MDPNLVRIVGTAFWGLVLAGATAYISSYCSERGRGDGKAANERKRLR